MAEGRGVEPRRAVNPVDFKSTALPIRLTLRELFKNQYNMHSKEKKIQ